MQLLSQGVWDDSEIAIEILEDNYCPFVFSTSRSTPVGSMLAVKAKLEAIS